MAHSGWNIYGELLRAQAELLGSDPTPALPGRIFFRTDQLKLKVDLGASVDSMAMLAASQTFAGSNTFSAAQILAQLSTPANPSAGFNKFYFKSDGSIYTLDSSGTETKVLTVANSLVVPTVQKFTATGTASGYLFTVTSANATIGATYTNNGNTYTVLATIASGTQLFCSQASAPAASGTLTKASGTGDATITFASSVALATYTTAASALYLRVRQVGAGGGGGGSGQGGDGGTGGTGGRTVFGSSLLVCTGGAGGTSANKSAGGAGGTASLGTGPIGTARSGASGSQGPGQSSSSFFAPGGHGGATPFGGSGGSSGDPQTGITPVANTGAGGGGGGNGGVTNAGSAGGGAGGFIDAIIGSPAATYYYAIGAGGAAGTAGTSGTAGGAGSAGYIEVTEYYQ